MKSSKLLLSGIASIMISANGLYAGSDLWPKNKGEVCWTTNGEIVRLAVVRTLNNHYLIHGTITEAGHKDTLINGNAEIIGDEVMMHTTLSWARVDEVNTYSGIVTLDLTTLNGTYEGLSNYYVKSSGETGISYDGPHNLNYIPCP